MQHESTKRSISEHEGLSLRGGLKRVTTPGERLPVPWGDLESPNLEVCGPENENVEDACGSGGASGRRVWECDTDPPPPPTWPPCLCLQSSRVSSTQVLQKIELRGTGSSFQKL